ncbi:unnamed protein product [Rotaria sp. Silwood1]|nr:unnamed protein product [Rotaria sp. Silwood1]
MDSDEEDKYKRRSIFTWFARWLRSRQPTNRKVLYHLTRGDNNEHLDRINDPQFNPLNNPFIRVGNRLLKNPLKDSNSLMNKDQ